MRIFLAVLILIATTAPAPSGAWLREPGTALLTFSRTADQQGNTHDSLFAEFGLTPRLTLGLDAGMARNGDWTAVGFLRRPLGRTDRPTHLAWEMGLGRDRTQTIIRSGLSVGRGFNSRWGSGWAAIDTVADFGISTFRTDYKADLTLGWHRDRAMLIMQMQAGDPAFGTPYAKFAPSYVRPLGKRMKLELGLSLGLVNDDTRGAKLGIWLEF